jgi:trehalose utilization protein
MASGKVRVVVWDESPAHAPKEMYPESIRGAVAEGLRELGGDRLEVQVAHLDEADQGVPGDLLARTDVLLWWAHARHGQVHGLVAERVVERVHEGMGFVALHSAHYSEPFRRLLNSFGHLRGGWREMDPLEPEEVTVCAPRHPIAEGLSDFVIPHEEMYGAPFDVPPPSCVIFQSYFPAGGEYFPSGLTWTVGPGKKPGFTSGSGKGANEGEGKGRVFYFRPGHETAPTYFDPNVRRAIYNGTLWCARQT